MAIKRYLLELFDAYKEAEFAFTNGSFANGNRRMAAYKGDEGDGFVLRGEGFTYDDGLVDQGFITSLTYVDSEVGALQRISGFRANAGQIAATNISEFLEQLGEVGIPLSAKVIGSSKNDIIVAASGSDIILGGKGADEIDGGAGRDRLTGGRGPDVFVFEQGSGKDVIVDFDAHGGLGAQDLIDASFSNDAVIRRDGKNTVLDWGHGDTLTLLNVKPAEIDGTDFAMS